MQLKGKASANNASVPKFWNTAKIRAFIGCNCAIYSIKKVEQLFI
jgi:hypothetical protein